MSATQQSMLKRPWVLLPLGILTAAFVAYSLPPYLGLDPAEGRVQLRDGFAIHYPLLVTHIFLGSVALLAACLQLWPWLRQHHPTVHRRSGRVYVWTAIPTGLCAIGISTLSLMGLNVQVGDVLFALVWLATTIRGYRAARRRRFSEHREWMVRSFALAFAIVANRVWMPLCMIAFVSDGTRAELEQAAGLSMWLSWVVNLLIAEWWLQRTRNRKRRAPTVTQPPENTSSPV